MCSIEVLIGICQLNKDLDLIFLLLRYIDIKEQETISPVEIALSKSIEFGFFEKFLVNFISRSVSPDIADKTATTLYFLDQPHIIDADLLIDSGLPTDVPPNFKTIIFINYGNIHLSIIK